MLWFGGLVVNSVGVLNSFILCVLCFVARLICLGCLCYWLLRFAIVFGCCCFNAGCDGCVDCGLLL